MSDELILPNLEIQGFRAFRKLQIERLGRVNLIVGKNNVGKTSVLEALRLYANPSPRVLLELISARDEFDQPQGPRPNGRRPTGHRPIPGPIAALFHGRPADPDRTPPISIGPIGAPYQTLLFGLTTGEQQGIQPGEPSPEDIDGDLRGGRSFVSFRIGPIPTKPLPMDDLARCSRHDQIINSWPDFETVPHRYISNDGLDPRSSVIAWQNINLTDYHKNITESLRIIEPRIEETSANVPSANKLVPIVRLEGSPEPITLRSMGDGMVRLFHLALALVNSIYPQAGGILLVDEIENGLHYSVHEDLWKLVFKMAKDLNAQVFATTHSWDCIEAFQRAACEDESSEGNLIRLGWRRDEVVATVYDENDLAIVTRDHIEVR
jgi:hypothetical protein